MRRVAPALATRSRTAVACGWLALILGAALALGGCGHGEPDGVDAIPPPLTAADLAAAEARCAASPVTAQRATRLTLEEWQSLWPHLDRHRDAWAREVTARMPAIVMPLTSTSRTSVLVDPVAMGAITKRAMGLHESIRQMDGTLVREVALALESGGGPRGRDRAEAFARSLEGVLLERRAEALRAAAPGHKGTASPSQICAGAEIPEGTAESIAYQAAEAAWRASIERDVSQLPGVALRLSHAADGALRETPPGDGEKAVRAERYEIEVERRHASELPERIALTRSVQAALPWLPTSRVGPALASALPRTLAAVAAAGDGASGDRTFSAMVLGEWAAALERAKSSDQAVLVESAERDRLHLSLARALGERLRASGMDDASAQASIARALDDSPRPDPDAAPRPPEPDAPPTIAEAAFLPVAMPEAEWQRLGESLGRPRDDAEWVDIHERSSVAWKSELERARAQLRREEVRLQSLGEASTPAEAIRYFAMVRDARRALRGIDRERFAMATAIPGIDGARLARAERARELAAMLGTWGGAPTASLLPIPGPARTHPSIWLEDLGLPRDQEALARELVDDSLEGSAAVASRLHDALLEATATWISRGRDLARAPTLPLADAAAADTLALMETIEQALDDDAARRVVDRFRNEAWPDTFSGPRKDDGRADYRTDDDTARDLEATLRSVAGSDSAILARLGDAMARAETSTAEARAASGPSLLRGEAMTWRRAGRLNPALAVGSSTRVDVAARALLEVRAMAPPDSEDTRRISAALARASRFAPPLPSSPAAGS